MKNYNFLNFLKNSIKPSDIINLKIENKINDNFHFPVMKNNVLSILENNFDFEDNFNLLDCTFGTGGHTFEILKKFKNIKITGLDLDNSMLEIDNKFENNLNLINLNFKNTFQLKKRFDFILCDLGYSINQLNSNRGLSYINDNNLDMRFDLTNNKENCEDIINKIPLLNLYEVFENYSNIKNSKEIAQNFIKYRKNKKIENKQDIIKIINMSPELNSNNNNKLLKLIYQSLRIITNDEYNNLDEFLDNLYKIKANNAIIVFISFHEMEHKLIKKYINKNKKYLKSIKIDIKPDKAEIGINKPSKSAKLFKFQFKDNLKIKGINLNNN